ncbi:MAG: hypothetical protein M1570_12660 [Chloroflexi bacterium]|nr:hypothetical protein [Chloroflexota bacterium]
MNFKYRLHFCALCAAFLLVWPLAGASASFDSGIFKDPPAEYRGWAMWGFNLSNVQEARITSGVENLAAQHYGDFFISVSGGTGKNLDPAYVRQARPFFRYTDDGIEYLSDDFFKFYRLAVEEAKKHGLEMLFYDDFEYPTGTVSGQLHKKYPQYMAKRLDKMEKDVSGPAHVVLSVPKGPYIGAVLMNRDTFARTDISAKRTEDNQIVCDVPAGNWKVMAFYLNTDAVLKIRNPGYVDYLDDTAMNTFMAMSYDKFYSHLKEYFGPVIKRSFYDEPSMHWLNGRMWTPGFNRKFQTRYGRSPMTYYPALWYDIGPETSAARNALYGFRTQLYADTFVRKITRWCHAHGIASAGHMDQEEVRNPVPVNGDLMKVFEDQDVPGADDIAFFGRANTGYKVVTSAAFNYDKPVIMAETYAAYATINEKNIFQVAMDQYAMGINFQVPWSGIDRRAKNVPDLNRYVGRLSYILQHGRHVADVAVLYPIASLQACYQFSPDPSPEEWTPDLTSHDLRKMQGPAWEYAYKGGNPPPEIDYMDIGETLFRGMRVDYTYLHPEVLETKCTAAGGKLTLNNKENREQYRVLIVPGGTTLRAATARKVRDFYQSGGIVIATSRLAFESAEAGRNAEVRQAIAQVFGLTPDGVARGEVPVDSATGYYATHNRAGGRAYFLPKPDAALLTAVLKEALPTRDVEIQEGAWPIGKGTAFKGALTYIHKVKDGRDIYFFANSSAARAVDTTVLLRGSHKLRIWNPHTGEQQRAEFTRARSGGSDVTVVRLALPPVTSLFYIEEPDARK